MKEEILFLEKQGFTQLWLWLLLAGLNLLFIYAYVQQTVFATPFGQKPASDMQLLVIMLVMLFISFFILRVRLETKITSEGIFVRFFPFQLASQKFYWDQMEECFVREYAPVKEFGGWGSRGTQYNRVLNVSGRQGIQLVFNNGARFLIGTNKPQEVEEILKRTGNWLVKS